MSSAGLVLLLAAQSAGWGRGFGDGKSQQPEDPGLLAATTWWYDWGLTPQPQLTSFNQEL